MTEMELLGKFRVIKTEVLGTRDSVRIMGVDTEHLAPSTLINLALDKATIKAVYTECGYNVMLDQCDNANKAMTAFVQIANKGRWK